MRPELEASLLHCRNLPSPPGVALQIIELAQDPNADLGATAHIISMDAALSARLLRVANSPLYAGRRRVDNLAQAMTMLGLNATLSLALGFSLVQGLRGHNGTAHEQERVWRRSVLAALAARLLGTPAGVQRAEDLMLAGLLQDIGRLALLQAVPDEYAALCARAADNDALLELEREVLGADHAEVGTWLARQWRLPSYLVDAIAASESTPEDAFQRCVHASGVVADLWLAPADPDGRLRERTLAPVRACTGRGTEALDDLLVQIAAALPEISALFEVRISRPEHLQAISDHAKELLILRNLREIQEATQARHDAQVSEERMRRLTEQSRRDPLTGVYNRLQMEEVLEREFATAVALQHPLSIAFVDLDDFKRINDQHGHLVGDQVLRQFAQTLQRMLRSTDLIARYGGEEFLVVLSHSNEAAATRVLQRILEEVARLPMAVVDGQSLYVTFSAGVATHDSAANEFSDARSLLQAADDALYGAKREGRNRVSQHGQ
ncbi:GGDEF domain-containing protein [Pseudoxanthomonas broegbernensis]|uniref:diguanylate cyclase n=1 Tax=Pseudoxanthomonas broegbernensis TaxID=83619 RepID=A0A7V8GMC2_9GAMM|nr:GGDEF domain-containing protein [Pseudoxanthomonas broegbernensis]KAF1686294.1 GGDEF domain-containing protein [Pseudoxanthomonas broegbernensis]MBB6063980.1 diguanylate cyclase (GGDEF)-like protein [Pseudoxanthomonas broegbernensis]